MRELVLRVCGVNKRFGGLQALSDVGIEIGRGEIYGLIGPNGAGKTTFFNVITGLYTPDSGTFELDGKPYAPTDVHRVAQAGIARTFQNIRLFPDMTALENVMVGRHVRTHATALGAILRTRRTVEEERAIKARSLELLEYVGIRKYADYQARTLAYGDQRRLEIARALATEPKLLALDEPAAGMNATEKLALRALLEAISRDGITILLIEHDVKLVMGLCDRVTVLDYGKMIAVGAPGRRATQSGGDRGVSGRRPQERGHEGGLRMSEVVLRVAGLKVAYGGIQAVKGVDLEVRAGELVTLIGANGAGKTSTLKAITSTQAWAGEIDYMGRTTRGLASYQLLAQGLAMVPEGRGVFARMTVTENLQMGAFVRNDDAGHQARHRRDVRDFPAPEGACEAARRHAVRWRTADAGHGTRADEPAEVAAARRTLDGPVAHHGRESLRGDPHRRGPQGADAAGRAECTPRTRGGASRVRDGIGIDHAERQRARSADRPQGARGLSGRSGLNRCAGFLARGNRPRVKPGCCALRRGPSFP